MATMEILLGHSPDPDDAFMFYGLAAGRVDPGPYRFTHILQDIETLNRRALRGELHVTAVSIHAYAHLADRYALLACGASMGDGYGPLLVARPGVELAAARGGLIAVPGTLTSAYLALRLAIGGFRHRVLPFDEIPARVAAGECDAGLLIHEGQLTYAREGLRALLDLGVWWSDRTGGLPLPLGGNAIRRDLGPARLRELAGILQASIRYGLAHRAEALRHALGYGRGLDEALADRFVGMYVNDYTLDYGERGREAVRRFLAEGRAAGLIEADIGLDFVSAAESGA